MTNRETVINKFCNDVISELNKSGAFLIKAKFNNSEEPMLWLDVANDGRDGDEILRVMREVKVKLMAMFHDCTGEWKEVHVNFRVRSKSEIFFDMHNGRYSVVA